MKNRTTIIAELKRELSMRRKVWRRIPGKPDQFVDFQQQQWYDTMLDTLIIFEGMTDRDFEAIKGRVDLNNSTTQTKLF